MSDADPKRGTTGAGGFGTGYSVGGVGGVTGRGVSRRGGDHAGGGDGGGVVGFSKAGVYFGATTTASRRAFSRA